MANIIMSVVEDECGNVQKFGFKHWKAQYICQRKP